MKERMIEDFMMGKSMQTYSEQEVIGFGIQAMMNSI